MFTFPSSKIFCFSEENKSKVFLRFYDAKKFDADKNHILIDDLIFSKNYGVSIKFLTLNSSSKIAGVFTYWGVSLKIVIIDIMKKQPDRFLEI